MTADAAAPLPDHLQSDPKGRIRAACTVWKRTDDDCPRCGGCIIQAVYEEREVWRGCQNGCDAPAPCEANKTTAHAK